MKLYRRADAVKYLEDTHGFKRSPKTLAKEAVVGGGPVITYINKTPYYAGPDLDDYAARLTSRAVSTSQRPAS